VLTSYSPDRFPQRLPLVPLSPPTLLFFHCFFWTPFRQRQRTFCAPSFDRLVFVRVFFVRFVCLLQWPPPLPYTYPDRSCLDVISANLAPFCSRGFRHVFSFFFSLASPGDTYSIVGHEVFDPRTPSSLFPGFLTILSNSTPPLLATRVRLRMLSRQYFGPKGSPPLLPSLFFFVCVRASALFLFNVSADILNIPRTPRFFPIFRFWWRLSTMVSTPNFHYSRLDLMARTPNRHSSFVLYQTAWPRSRCVSSVPCLLRSSAESISPIFLFF